MKDRPPRFKHGQSDATGKTASPTYMSWQGMKQRCFYPKHKDFASYGGRGITICERWLDKDHGFENFLADMGERPAKRTLDRREVNGNYEPSNCRWATYIEQRQNQRKMKQPKNKITIPVAA